MIILHMVVFVYIDFYKGEKMFISDKGKEEIRKYVNNILENAASPEIITQDGYALAAILNYAIADDEKSYGDYELNEKTL